MGGNMGGSMHAIPPYGRRGVWLASISIAFLEWRVTLAN